MLNVTGVRVCDLCPGISSCYTFRAATYAKLGIAGADRVRREKYAPHHLVIWARKGRRGFENLDEVIKCVRRRPLPLTVLDVCVFQRLREPA